MRWLWLQKIIVPLACGQLVCPDQCLIGTQGAIQGARWYVKRARWIVKHADCPSYFEGGNCHALNLCLLYESNNLITIAIIHVRNRVNNHATFVSWRDICRRLCEFITSYEKRLRVGKVSRMEQWWSLVAFDWFGLTYIPGVARSSSSDVPSPPGVSS